MTMQTTVREFLIYCLYPTIFILLTSCAQTDLKREIPEGGISSLVLTGYGVDTYQKASVNFYLNELKELNANTASFLYTCYVENTEDSSIDCKTFDSPKLERIKWAIEKAKSMGFFTNLRFYIDLKDHTWRAHWDPEDKERTFESLEKELQKIAKFSERNSVDLLIIGAELSRLTVPQYTSKWEKIISNIRKSYSGLLTYGANWSRLAELEPEWRYIKFWPSLDFIGIDHYHPIPESKKGLQIARFQELNFSKYTAKARLFGKLVLITELGFPGHKDGHIEPFEWRLKGENDQERQASNYRYTFQAIKNSPDIKGVFVWRKESKSEDLMKKGQAEATGFELYKRRAWYELQEFFMDY